MPKQRRAGERTYRGGRSRETHGRDSRRVKRFNVAEDWTFTGPRYGEDIRGEYNCVDLFVLPTFNENFSSVVVEVLSQKVPVITTKGTPWMELEERHCRWWIDIGVEPLSIAFKEAMSLDGAHRREMGEGGRKLLEERYTWDAVVKAMVKGDESL